MAQLQAPFNAQQFDPTQGGSFQQLPVGKHPVVIVASEIKPTADNSGGMIVYQLQVIDGPAKGAEGPYRVNLYNASDKARSIAESQMSALCYVTGKFMNVIGDTCELHNIPFVVEVKEQTLTPAQVEKKNNGETVTPFTAGSLALRPTVRLLGPVVFITPPPYSVLVSVLSSTIIGAMLLTGLTVATS